MTDGLVSIITPCYNGTRYIAETINSVIAQTYQSWEMIVVDDGSTDSLDVVMAPYLAAEPRIRLLHRSNAGSAAARNTGLRQAQGQYIALLDADDVWHPDFLEKQLAFMKVQNAACVCCSYGHIDAQSRPVGSPTRAKSDITVKDMQVMNYVACLTGLYDTEKCGRLYLDETLKIRDDYAYWYEVIKRAGRASGNSEILADYRVYSGSSTGKKIRLIPSQYHFYRDYLHLAPLRSAVNVLRWGAAGLAKFR